MNVCGFIAFPVSGGLKEKFEHVIRDLQSTHTDVRWVKAENIHLTAIGTFPDGRHPKIIWGALDDPRRAIRGIAGILEKRLALCGVAHQQRPFLPHITLGRGRSSTHLKDLMRIIGQMTFEDKIAQKLDKIILYKSTLTPQGPVYEALKAFEMGKGRGTSL